MGIRHSVAVASALFVGVLISLPLQSAFAGGQQTGGVDTKTLKSYIEGMGYTVKLARSKPGDEMYEFICRRSGFTVYIDAELSSSKNYIWISTYFNTIKDPASIPASKYFKLLKDTSEYGPCHFNIGSDGRLNMSLAVDNRAMSAVIFRNAANKLIDAIIATVNDWKGLGS